MPGISCKMAVTRDGTMAKIVERAHQSHWSSLDFDMIFFETGSCFLDPDTCVYSPCVHLFCGFIDPAPRSPQLSRLFLLNNHIPIYPTPFEVLRMGTRSADEAMLHHCATLTASARPAFSMLKPNQSISAHRWIRKLYAPFILLL